MIVPANIGVIRNKDVACFEGRNNRLLTKYYQNSIALEWLNTTERIQTDDFWHIWRRKLKSEFLQFANKHCKYGTLILAYLKSVEI
jgi:hypothetical protein